MKRRDIIRWAGTGAVLAVAGCLGGDTDSEEADGSDGNEDTMAEEGDDGSDDGDYEYDSGDRIIQEFVKARQEGNVAKANALMATDGEIEPFDESDNITENAPEVIEIEYCGQCSQGTPNVVFEVLLDFPVAEEPVPDTVKIDQDTNKIVKSETLRRYDPTEMSFSFEQGDGELTIHHDSGDALPATDVFIRGNGIETGAWHELSSDIDEGGLVRPGDTVSIDVDDSYNLQVVYDDGEETETIAGKVEH